MGGGGGGVRTGRVGDGGREVDPEAFGCAGAFDLAFVRCREERKDSLFGALVTIHPTGA